ncbi:MAG: PLxRFG domain-containing protein, partial [Sphaerochaeta sp.]|nr:PLxRFG domain-containing protein [Sphaerochaeta sp.]
MWSKFVSAIRTLLGLDSSADTALSEVLRTGEQILDAPVSQMLEAAMTQNGPATSRQTMSMQVESQMLSTVVDTALKAGQDRVTQAAQSLANPKGKLYDLYVQYAPQWLSVTPLRTLVQTFGKRIPQIKRFSDHLNSVVAAKTEIVDRSAVIYDNVEKLTKKTVGLDTFNLCAATASFNRITPWEDQYTQGWVKARGTRADQLKGAQKAWEAAGMQKTTGKTYLEAYRESVEAYQALNKNGNEDLQQAYISAVEHISSIRSRERNNLLSYIEAVSEAGSDARNELMMKFNASFSNLQGAYWPLARFGDFVLEYTAVDGFRHVEHFMTIAERNASKADLMEGGVDPATVKEDYKNKTPRGSVAIPQMLIDQLRTAATAKAMQGVNPNDPDAVAAVNESVQATIDDMNQIWLRWQPETSALKNSVRRKNVKGFSEDMLRGYLTYMQAHATSIAWSEQGKKIEADIKSLSDDLSGKKAEGAVDITMDRHILNDLRNRVQALRSVSVGSAASFLGKLGTGYYMTSPSIALVQMTQLGVLTLPKLATEFGLGKASAALAAGTKDAFSKKFTRGPMFEDPVINMIFDNLRAVVTDENRALPPARGKELGDRLYTREQLLSQMRDLTPDQVKLLTLREAMARNLLDISAAHEAYELTRGKDPKSMRSKIFKLAMLPMSLSELTSRKAAILATLNLAQGKGKNFFESMDSIADVVDDTLYSYAKENKGSAMQGGFTRVLLQFQHYRIMTGIRLALLFNNAIRGETPEVKAAARKEFIGVMGMSGAFAGTMGLPMASLLFSCLAMFDDDDDPQDYKLMYTNWLKEQFGETGG